MAWREEVARVKRAAFADQEYWGRPLPGFGDPQARIVVLGLAPAAHGGNRTGRVFTGDRSGDWLFAALCRAGLANQPESVAVDDGLAPERLLGVCRRALRPTGQQADPGGARHLPALLRPESSSCSARARVIVCLGGFAWAAALRALPAMGFTLPGPDRASATGRKRGSGEYTLLGCYHPSQQNTFTGRLTEPMLDAVFAQARELAGLPGARTARG